MLTRSCLAIPSVGLFLFAAGAAAAGPEYRVPSDGVAAIVDASPAAGVSVGPRRDHLLVLERQGLPSIADLAQPELRLAGLRINPRNSSRSRSSYFVGLDVLTVRSGEKRRVTGLPAEPRLMSPRWSPDGRSVAFVHVGDTQVELWLLDVESGAARRLVSLAMNSAQGAPCSWLADSRRLLCRAVPVDRPESPVAPLAPTGPVVQESSGRKAAARTYQDLLENDHDAVVFEHFLTSQLVVVEVDGGTRTIGDEGLIVVSEPSPDGRFVLVETLRRPFSYLVPWYRFPHRVSVLVLESSESRVLADLPLAEEIPIGRGAVPTGPRSHGWRADEPSTVFWVEARDGGDPRADSEIRDEVLLLPAPFDGEPRSLIELGLRYAGILWGSSDLAIVEERWWRTRRVRSWRIRPGGDGGSSVEKQLLFDRSSEDRYANPGSPVLGRNPFGRSVLATSDGSIFLSGLGASPEGDRPFLDRLDLESGDTERLWRSQAPHYESFVAFLDEDRREFLTRREAPVEMPNYFRRRLDGGDPVALTAFEHPYPQMAKVYKEVLRYKREDGVDLQGTLYLPPGKAPEDGPFPMFLWAYPREYKDAAAAGQMRGSPHRFKTISVRGPLALLAAGFAIFDGPTMPVIGVGEEEPNDTFVEQLVSSARAAIDEVVRRGVAEADRVAIGGHSYGAFMTANLLAHSDLFRVGIARSGAYNRTLTPFGFQAEERTFWESPEVYFAMSPFMHADKVNEPILMLHGEADNNSGTFPLQSQRFYNALKGHGAKARLVMLPHESHGYASRESVLHTLYEMEAWLDRYLRDGGDSASSGSGGSY